MIGRLMSLIVTIATDIEAQAEAEDEQNRVIQNQVMAYPSDTIAPTAPTGLTATPASTSQINLAWTDASSDEAGFRVYRSTNDVTYAQVGVDQAAGTQAYSDTTITAGVTYYYKVAAFDAAGNEGMSSSASTNTLLLNLVAYWKLNESSDGSAPVQRNDSAGVNHLSDALQCLSVAGILSNGLVVAPSKQISIADNAALSMGAGVAFEIWGWVKVTTGLAAFQEAYLVNKNGASSEYNVLIYKPDANTYIQAYLRKSDNSGTITVRATTYGTFATGVWVFFDLYHNPTTDLSGIAINDGVFDTQANTFDVRDSNNDLNLGGASAGTGRAILDEVGIVKGRVLTAAERTALYNAGVGKTHPF